MRVYPVRNTRAFVLGPYVNVDFTADRMRERERERVATYVARASPLSPRSSAFTTMLAARRGTSAATSATRNSERQLYTQRRGIIQRETRVGRRVCTALAPRRSPSARYTAASISPNNIERERERGGRKPLIIGISPRRNPTRRK